MNVNFCKFGGTVNEMNKRKIIGIARRKNCWEVSICKRPFYKYIGRFKTKLEAILAYNKASVHYFGDKAFIIEINNETLSD